MSKRSTGATAGRPPRTSRSEILAAARGLIERDGWEKLTIRTLAGEIGTSPGTVYNHVRDRDDLLIQLLSAEAEEFLEPRPELPDEPSERIVAVARLMHDGIAARPWVAEAITGDDLLGDSALWLVEEIVAAGVAAGASPEDAVDLYRRIWYYTAGEILVRARRERRSVEDRPTYRDEVFARLDPDIYPRLASLADRWTDLTARDSYVDGVRALVDGVLKKKI